MTKLLSAKVPGLLLLTALVFAPIFALAQLNTENGYGVPPDTRGHFLRVLVIFAEVDYGPCGGADLGGGTFAEWPKGAVPNDADTYFDHSLDFGRPVRGFLTDYYYQMSFGRHVLLGDYYPKIVTVPCADADHAIAGSTDEVVRSLNGMNGPLISKNGYRLDDFDHWSDPGPGRQKGIGADDRIDVLLILWRNLDPIDNVRPHVTGARGFAVLPGAPGASEPLGNKTGSNNAGSFSAPRSGVFMRELVIQEYFHALFGSNNWHTASGAGTHTFQAAVGSFATSGQSAAAATVASGWDRQHLGWRNPAKQHLISALDESFGEIPTDLHVPSRAGEADGGVFILRDFVTTGDAVRIRLPHLRWRQLGDVKNQYLWLENHQLQESPRPEILAPFRGNLPRTFDINAQQYTQDCQKKWTKGIYAYVQVGKDIKAEDVNRDGAVDEQDLFPAACSGFCGDTAAQHPNALAGWLFPLPAEGRFDFLYRLDQVTPAGSEDCQFDNVGIPIERERSLANPFTGYSDLFLKIDFDNAAAHQLSTFLPLGDGTLFTVDDGFKSVVTDFRNGRVERELPQFGDAEDAYRCDPPGCGGGNVGLSLSTNPAPVPVYTHRSDLRSANTAPRSAGFGSFENRTIFLTGLSIEILEESITVVDGGVSYPGATKIRVRWDNWSVNRNVRWTGNIVVQHDHDDTFNRPSQVVVEPQAQVALEQGLSPARHDGTRLPSGEFLFARPTILTLQDAGGITIRDGAALVVGRGSTLRLRVDLGNVVVQGRGKLVLEDGTFLCVEIGSLIVLEDPDSQIVVKRGARQGANPDALEIGSSPPPCRLGTIGFLGRGSILLPAGDIDGNFDVDLDDLAKINAALNTKAIGPSDPRDLDHDGMITALDARKLVTLCTRPRCARR